MNKLHLLKAQAKAINAHNERSERSDVAAQAIAAKLAGRADITETSQVPLNKLELKKKIANTALGLELREIPFSSEIDRIIHLPIIHPMDEAEFEEYCKMNILADAFNGTEDTKGFRLFEAQAEAICAYEQYSGGFFPIGVGFGKTLVTLVIAYKAWLKGLKRVLLLVPSQVFDQLTSVDIKWARSRVPFNMPVIALGGRDAVSRKALCASGKKGLYIMPHSYLSVKDTTQMLLDIQPQLIIVDEAHALANRNSARTKRLMDFVEKYKPEGVVLSGTITSKSVRDYFHLSKWVLKQYNFLPNSSMLANDWAQIIDAQSAGSSDGISVDKSATGPLMPLIRWAERSFPTEEIYNGKTQRMETTKTSWHSTIPGFRKAYKKRMTTAPGVVSSGDASIGTSLTFCNRPVTDEATHPGWDDLQKMWKKVEDEWVTPCGDEIEHAIHTWKWLYELTLGFYNELTWPTDEMYAKRKKIGENEAHDILDRAQKHHRAGQVYASSLRKWFDKNHKPFLDTPFLVGQDMSRNGSKNVGEDLYMMWKDWKNLDFEGRPDRDSKAIRVCPYKIVECVKWAKALTKGEGALVWVHHQEIGEWCYEELVKAGLEAAHCPAGDAYNTMLTAEDKPLKNKIVVASMPAHGTGKNLQYIHNNYFLQWPRQAIAAEQTVGRTHRNGQEADELQIVQNMTNEFDQLNFAACLNDALYIHQTTGNRQKLIYGNYDPLPKIFPSAVIHERGGQNRILTREQQKMLAERFER